MQLGATIDSGMIAKFVAAFSAQLPQPWQAPGARSHADGTLALTARPYRHRAEQAEIDARRRELGVARSDREVAACRQLTVLSTANNRIPELC